MCNLGYFQTQPWLGTDIVVFKRHDHVGHYPLTAAYMTFTMLFVRWMCFHFEAVGFFLYCHFILMALITQYMNTQRSALSALSARTNLNSRRL
jgi:hypothetical protein